MLHQKIVNFEYDVDLFDKEKHKLHISLKKKSNSSN